MLSNLSKVLAARAAELQDLKARRDKGETIYTHLPTNLKEFDSRFGGLEIGILTLVIAHSGDGKTAFLAHLAKAAAQAGFGVLLVLLEDPAAKLADRYLSAVMGESANSLARLQFDDPARLQAAVNECEWAQRVGLVSGQHSAKEILDLVDSTKAVGGAPLRLVVVDYAQSLAQDEASLEKVCADVAWGLNARANERGFATVLGSQCKQEVLQRGRARWERTLASGNPDINGYRPGKGDAQWSSRLGHFAKAVWSLFRPGRWRRSLGDTSVRDNRLEIAIDKANFSQEGMATFEWEGSSCTISDLRAT